MSQYKDQLIALALGFITCIVLCTQLNAPGVTWDEGLVNFDAAKNQSEWLRNLFTLDAPFSKETIDQYWFTTSDHPSLPRTMAAVCHLLFTGFVDEVAALRLPSALLFSVLTVSLFLFLRAFIDLPSAMFGALSLICMPRVWGHAHLFSLDLPIMCWWFWTTITAYWVGSGRWNPVWFGLVYALSFSTKLHAVFLPFPLLLWIVIVLYQNQEERILLAKRAGWSVFWAVMLTPLIYIFSQPWLWHDTVPRVIERFSDYSHKSAISLYYLGQIYRENTPWHYPFVMVSVTIPAAILVFVLTGLLTPIFNRFKTSTGDTPASAYHLHTLLVLMFLSPLLLILLKQAYDGCRLFLACFPLAALLAGFGFAWVWNSIHRFIKTQWGVWVMLIVVLSSPLYSLYSYHPFYLAYYNEWVGGIRGAKEKGFETVYWCDALTKDFLNQINEILPDDQTVHPKSMEHKIIDYYIERGWVKESFKNYPWDYALLQSRQSMFPREEWILYLQRRPIIKQELHGVQLYGLYQLE